MSDEREEESNKSRGFKVIDRRRFTEEGDLRAGVETKPVVQKATEPATDELSAKEPSEEVTENTESTQSAEEEHDSLLFVAFLKSLVTQGMMQLGVVPHPATGQPEMHLEGAQETLEILSMLKSKTQGNLTDDEEQLISDVLNQLGLIYSDLMQKLAAQAMQEQKGPTN